MKNVNLLGRPVQTLTARVGQDRKIGQRLSAWRICVETKQSTKQPLYIATSSDAVLVQYVVVVVVVVGDFCRHLGVPEANSVRCWERWSFVSPVSLSTLGVAGGILVSICTATVGRIGQQRVMGRDPGRKERSGEGLLSCSQRLED